MTTLIIAEKPQAAMRIANAIADAKPQVKTSGGVKYYVLDCKGERTVVAPAVGHLYTLYSEEKGYPVLNPDWKESWSVNKRSAFSKKYLKVLKSLAKRADKFINACDYDTEGSVIGFNILRFACGRKDAKRMKFSTLTKPDLVSAYSNALPHLDFPQVDAGLTRHHLDYFWGISVSRALIESLQKYGKRFQLLSTGRVQGPTLAILAEREAEIVAFKPKPYWELQLIAGVDSGEIAALHEKGKFWDKEEASSILEKCRNKIVRVTSLKTSTFKVFPPFPFDLTSLQIEAYRCFGFRPTVTLSIAQDLYSRALISYPRTSSQKLPPKIGYRRILTELSKQNSYSKIASEIASKRDLKPVQGKKTDPAHPCVYPTGVPPKRLTVYEQKLYDLIVRRFFALFGEPAVRETTNLRLEVEEEGFLASGVKTLKPGWFFYYNNYARYPEKTLPSLSEGQVLLNKGLTLLAKKTQPPKRFTQASIIREMEKRGLGTKATRSEIVQTLYDRNYVKDREIKVTKLGSSVIKTLKTYAPDVVSVDLTKEFDKDMENILKGKKKKEQVLKEAIEELKKIAEEFRRNEAKIGESLSKSIAVTKEEESVLGPCPKCGKQLRLLYSRKNKSYFVGCSGYPECKNMYPVPGNAKIKPTGKVCKVCGTPIIKVYRKGRRTFEMCLDTNCKTKKDWGKKS